MNAFFQSILSNAFFLHYPNQELARQLQRILSAFLLEKTGYVMQWQIRFAGSVVRNYSHQGGQLVK